MLPTVQLGCLSGFRSVSRGGNSAATARRFGPGHEALWNRSNSKFSLRHGARRGKIGLCREITDKTRSFGAIYRQWLEDLLD